MFSMISWHNVKTGVIMTRNNIFTSIKSIIRMTFQIKFNIIVNVRYMDSEMYYLRNFVVYD